MENSEFEALIDKKTGELDEIIERYLPAEEGEQKAVIQAMNYSIRAGGKRLRPMLMWETFLLCGGRKEDEGFVAPFLAAVEMIHTYSLVHDDLPAMDNDEYRRGKLTTHAKYGEAMGILAGDGLLNFAFETAAKAFELTDDAGSVGRALQVLARKAGVYGMLGGQVIDVESEGKPDMTLEKITRIHTLKTAALMEASLMTGAILAGAKQYEVELMEQAARNVGIAFQIQDDILDVTSTQEVLGKPIGSDARNEKTTYVSLRGIDESAREVRRLSREACGLLRRLERDSAFLEELFHILTVRNT